MPSVFPPPIAPTWDISQRKAEPPPFPEMGLDNILGEQLSLPGEIPTPELPEEFDSSTFATRPSIPQVTAPQDLEDDVSVSNSIVQNMENMMARVLGTRPDQHPVDGMPYRVVGGYDQQEQADPFADFGKPVVFNQGQRNQWQSGQPVQFQGPNGRPSQMRGSSLGGAYRTAGTPTVPNATARYYQRAANRGTGQRANSADNTRVQRYLNRAPEQI